MRFPTIAIAALAAVSTVAQAQEGEWQFYQDDAATNGLLQAYVRADDGAQLILKCDEAGKRQVYAVVTATEQLVPPRTSFQERTAKYRADLGPQRDDQWRFYETSVLAVNTPREKSLARFLEVLADAKELEVRLDRVQGNEYVAHFNVEGSRDAINQVFASCEDQSLID